MARRPLFVPPADHPDRFESRCAVCDRKLDPARDLGASVVIEAYAVQQVLCRAGMVACEGDCGQQLLEAMAVVHRNFERRRESGYSDTTNPTPDSDEKPRHQ